PPTRKHLVRAAASAARPASTFGIRLATFAAESSVEGTFARGFQQPRLSRKAPHMLTRHQVRIGLIVCALSVSQAIAAADERTQFPPEARKRYEQGRQLQQKGQLKEALAAYEEAAKLGMADFPRLHLQRASATA